MENVYTIQKEDLSSLDFCQDDVLESENEERKSKRIKDLKKATTLGNGYRRKVKLIFKKSDGLVNQVETTIWAVGNSFVTLKAGTTIPINSIYKVDFEA